MQTISPSTEAPKSRQSLAARIVMWLWVAAAALTLIAIPLSWSIVTDAVRAGRIPADQQVPAFTIFTLYGIALTAVYLGAAWACRSARSWLLALALSGIALFGWPAGTILGVVSIVVLCKKNVRANFRA